MFPTVQLRITQLNKKTIRMIELSTNKDNMAILYDNKNNIREHKEILEDYDLPLLKAQISQRVSFNSTSTAF